MTMVSQLTMGLIGEAIMSLQFSNDTKKDWKEKSLENRNINKSFLKYRLNKFYNRFNVAFQQRAYNEKLSENIIHYINYYFFFRPHFCSV